MKAMRIAAWDRAHENYDTSKRVNGLSWIAFPTAHDTLGFKRVMREPDGLAIYAAYVLCVQISARLPKDMRGRIVDRDGRPLDPEALSEMTGAPAAVFARAFEVLTSERVAWFLPETDAPAETCDTLQNPAEPCDDVRTSAEACGDLRKPADVCGNMRTSTVYRDRDRTIPDRTIPNPNATADDRTPPDDPEPTGSDSGEGARGDVSASVRRSGEADGGPDDRICNATDLFRARDQAWKSLGRILGGSHRGDRRQAEADATTLDNLCRHVIRGPTVREADDQAAELLTLANEKANWPGRRRPAIASFIAAAKGRWGSDWIEKAPAAVSLDMPAPAAETASGAPAVNVDAGGSFKARHGLKVAAG